MKSHLTLLCSVAAAVSLTACASLAVRLPDVAPAHINAEQIRQEGDAFEELQVLQARLSRVTAPIMAANAELCPKTRYDIGVATHTLKSYSKALRPAAAREWGAGAKHRVKYVRPKSPAHNAGIKVGDYILSADGEPVSARSKLLQAQMQAGETTLMIRRGADMKSVTVTPEEICGYSVNLRMSSVINAYATGKSIVITSGMMKFAETDEELALVIGHELAHNTMKHIRKSITNAVLSGMAHRYTRPFEGEADYVGLYYLVRAGYNPRDVEAIWRRMARVNPRSVARSKTHPKFPDRFLRIGAARDEIKAKQAAGEALIPNFIDAKTKASYVPETSP